MAADGLDLLQHRTRPAEGAPQGALVLLHGRGTDEHDLLPLADALDPDRRLIAVTPRGPLTFPGQPGAHWYRVRRVGFPWSRWSCGRSKRSISKPAVQLRDGKEVNAVVTYDQYLSTGCAYRGLARTRARR